MLIKILRGWEIPEREATPEAFYLSRRQFIQKLGWGGIGAAMTLPGWDRAVAARRDNAKSIYPAKREERLYRHRCVEAWSMAVPWTGFPLKALIDLAQPLSPVKFVRLISFNKPEQAPGMKSQSWYPYPWPY